MIRHRVETITLTSHRAKRLKTLVHLLKKEGVLARITGPWKRKLIIPSERQERDGIRLSPVDTSASLGPIDPVFEKQTERLLVGIGLLAGFSITQLLFQLL